MVVPASMRKKIEIENRIENRKKIDLEKQISSQIRAASFFGCFFPNRARTGFSRQASGQVLRQALRQVVRQVWGGMELTDDEDEAGQGRGRVFRNKDLFFFGAPRAPKGEAPLLHLSH